MVSCVPVCARSPLSGGASVTAGCTSILLRREGITLNHKKLRRLYAEERLQVRRRGGRKRALGTRAPLKLRRAQTSTGRWISCMIS